MIGVLLPMVPENYVTLVAGPTAGILAPVNWALSADAIANVMRAAKVNVLVALGPSPEFTIWETAQNVAEQVASISHVIQVRGPGGEKHADTNFNTLFQFRARHRRARHRHLLPHRRRHRRAQAGAAGAWRHRL